MSRYLLKRGTSRVLPMTPQLAQRPDMLECDAEGNVKAAAFASPEDQSETIAHLQAANEELKAENQALRDALQRRDTTINELNARIGEMQVGRIPEPPPPGVGVSVPGEAMTGPAAEPRPLGSGPEGQAAGGEDGAGNEVDGDKVPIEKVVEAIGQLEPDNNEHFTAAGLPRVEILEDLLDAAVDMELRNAAWEQYQELQKQKDQ